MRFKSDILHRAREVKEDNLCLLVFIKDGEPARALVTKEPLKEIYTSTEQIDQYQVFNAIDQDDANDKLLRYNQIMGAEAITQNARTTPKVRNKTTPKLRDMKAKEPAQTKPISQEPTKNEEPEAITKELLAQSIDFLDIKTYKNPNISPFYNGKKGKVVVKYNKPVSDK